MENDATNVGHLQNGHGPWDESMKKVTYFFLSLIVIRLEQLAKVIFLH